MTSTAVQWQWLCDVCSLIFTSTHHAGRIECVEHAPRTAHSINFRISQCTQYNNLLLLFFFSFRISYNYSIIITIYLKDTQRRGRSNEALRAHSCVQLVNNCNYYDYYYSSASKQIALLGSDALLKVFFVNAFDMQCTICTLHTAHTQYIGTFSLAYRCTNK